MNDNVNNPKHYQLLPGVQVIDVRDVLLNKIDNSACVNLSSREVDCWSRSWEYLTRFMEKNGLEDLEKAMWYLERMILSMKGGQVENVTDTNYPLPFSHAVIGGNAP